MKTSHLNKVKKNSEPITPVCLKRSFSLIIIAYGLIAVITPGFGAWDSNGTKFFFLSLLNLVSFLFLMSHKEIRGNNEIKFSFITNRIGFVYVLLLLLSLLSFVKAINIVEAYVALSKFFTIFSSAFIISIILRTNQGYLKQLSMVMVLLLIVDCLTVFVNVVAYVKGNIQSISVIQSVYSNKNILTSAIFVKIPFALWLISFHEKLPKYLGFIALFFSVVSILLLSTRAFYIGIIIISIAYIAFLLIQTVRKKEGRRLRLLFIYLGLIVTALIIFSGIQLLVFSKLKPEDWNKDVVSRLETINDELASGGRVAEWKMSGKLIQENPMLGVGVGNWKICILKYENKIREGFVFLHHNHNDFIQTIAETGIIAGILFVILFILIGLNFIVAFFRADTTNESYKYLFIPAFGILAYSVDAFFNFPYDRPEIGTFFAFFVGMGIASSSSNLFVIDASPVKIKKKPDKKLWFSNIQVFIFLPLMMLATYVLYTNFISLRIQMVVAKDLTSDVHQLKFEQVQNEFPSIPSIDAVDEPIALVKARYLILEEKFEDAVDLLKNDHSSPYYANNEYFIALAYSKMGQVDSALVHISKAYSQKPVWFYLYKICKIYEQQGNRTKALEMVNSFIEKNRTNHFAWSYVANLANKSGDLNKAILLVNSGLKYSPKDSSLLKHKESLERQLKIKPFESIYKNAVSAFKKEDYINAARYFSDFLDKEPTLIEAYEYRATCYLKIKQYQNSIADINKVLISGVREGSLFNMRGEAFHNLGNDLKACADFQTGIKLGDTIAEINYQKYCNTAKK
jgi:putative inorganic carbon (hco3(-)) transporter